MKPPLKIVGGVVAVGLVAAAIWWAVGREAGGGADLRASGTVEDARAVSPKMRRTTAMSLMIRSFISRQVGALEPCLLRRSCLYAFISPFFGGSAA